ncbi:hypothetical protein PMAYCL1PPCAC_07902, partial [Pristionchus mayeri]
VFVMAPRSVLVTGGASGIGLGFVRHYLAIPEVEHVIVASINVDKEEEVQSITDPRLHVFELDVREDESVVELEKKVSSLLGDSGLTLLINNAGYGDAYDLDAAPDRAKIMNVFNINAFGPLVMSQVFLPLLRKASLSNSSLPVGVNRAAIVNISSGMASMTDNTSGGGVTYRASKTALNSITRTIGHHSIKDEILTVAILPGAVKTRLSQGHGNLTVEESVALMTKVFDTWTRESNGLYYSKDGGLFLL